MCLCSLFKVQKNDLLEFKYCFCLLNKSQFRSRVATAYKYIEIHHTLYLNQNGHLFIIYKTSDECNYSYAYVKNSQKNPKKLYG